MDVATAYDTGPQGIQYDPNQYAYDFDTPLPDEHPTVQAWRCLVMPYRPPERTAGGIIIPDATKDNSIHLNPFGRLVAKGPSAFRSPRLFPGMTADEIAAVPKPQVGDWIIWSRHTGTLFEYAGWNLFMVPDDAILAVLADPTKYKVTV